MIADQLDAIVADLTALGDAKDPRGLALFDGSAAAIPVADGIAVLAERGQDPRVRQRAERDHHLRGSAAHRRPAPTVAADSATAITALNAATANVASVQGAVGARAARVELVAANADSNADVVERQRTAIEDTDLTAAITDLQRTMTDPAGDAGELRQADASCRCSII